VEREERLDAGVRDCDDEEIAWRFFLQGDQVLRTILASVLAVGLASSAWGVDRPEPFSQGKIVMLDPELKTVLDPSATIEQLGEGYEWSEGPAWNKRAGYLVFSDIPRNSVMKYQPGEGVSLFLKPSGYDGAGEYSAESGSNGLLYDAAGRLILCQHGNRRVARMEADGKVTSLADRFDGKRFNSPNDAVLMSNGDLYFTDPPYGLPKQAEDPSRELDFCGVYRLSKDGKVTLLTDKMTRPNGIGFSPDEKTLYVAQSDPSSAVWMSFDVQSDGTIANGRTFFDSTEWVGKEKGLPDGLEVAGSGHIFATGPGGVLIFSPDGKHLGTIATGEATANCGFGGKDGSTLYITADMYLLRVPTKTKGQGY
jgi:gluconolactonase